MNSLSSKLEADYIELINPYLDHLPITKEEEFEMTSLALKAILNKEDFSNLTISESLKENIFSINELLVQPELYVEKKENYEEYRTFLSLRIAKKINEISKMSLGDKKQYIEEYNNKKQLKNEKHQALSQHQQPDASSDKHVSHLSADELAEDRQLFYNKLNFLEDFAGKISNEKFFELDVDY